MPDDINSTLRVFFDYTWIKSIEPLAMQMEQQCQGIIRLRTEELKDIKESIYNDFFAYVGLFLEHMRNHAHGLEKRKLPTLDHHKMAAALIAALLVDDQKTDPAADSNLFEEIQQQNKSKVRVMCCFYREILAFHAGLDAMQVQFRHLDDIRQAKRPNLIKHLENDGNYFFPQPLDERNYDFHMCKTLHYMRKRSEDIDVFQLAHLLFFIEAYSELALEESYLRNIVEMKK